MRLTSINLGKPESHQDGKDDSPTGIYKRPISHPVTVTLEGLTDDAICNTLYHGGPDQAVYIYGEPEYAHWESLLGQKLAPGTFGENLTMTELETVNIAVGDRFIFGEVTLQVTSPRTPCGTLSRKMRDPRFLKRFREEERCGAYCRVLKTGVVQTGEEVRFEPYEGERVMLLELYREFYSPTKDPDLVRRHLASPLASRVRQMKEALLAKLTA